MDSETKEIKTCRNSSIELLRIICMLFIVIYHFIIKTNTCWQLDANFSTFVLPLHVAVICFILITGYYGTNLNIRKITSLGIQTIFYCVLSYFVVSIINDTFSAKGFINSFRFLTRNPDIWFIRTYILLLLCVPAVNLWINTPPRTMEMIGLGSGKG